MKERESLDEKDDILLNNVYQELMQSMSQERGEETEEIKHTNQYKQRQQLEDKKNLQKNMEKIDKYKISLPPGNLSLFLNSLNELFLKLPEQTKLDINNGQLGSLIDKIDVLNSQIKELEKIMDDVSMQGKKEYAEIMSNLRQQYSQIFFNEKMDSIIGDLEISNVCNDQHKKYKYYPS